jgi:hypothetical protein
LGAGWRRKQPEQSSAAASSPELAVRPLQGLVWVEVWCKRTSVERVTHLWSCRGSGRSGALMRRRGRLCALRVAGERVCSALWGSGVCATMQRNMRKTCASMCRGCARQYEAAGHLPWRSYGKGRRRAAHKLLECNPGLIDEHKRQRRPGRCSPRGCDGRRCNVGRSSAKAGGGMWQSSRRKVESGPLQAPGLLGSAWGAPAAAVEGSV